MSFSAIYWENERRDAGAQADRQGCRVAGRHRHNVSISYENGGTFHYQVSPITEHAKK